MHVKVILNPWADRGRAIQLEEQIAAWGHPFGRVDVVLTEAPGHAEMLATEAAEAGYHVVAAAGGDGTMNEVANGLLAARATPSPAFGLIPIGSGNDYAYGMGLLAPPLAAVQRLFKGERRLVDVAEISDGQSRRRFALNGIGVGFDAAVAIESLKITRIYGFPLYVLAALRTILFRYHAPHFELRFDEERVSQRSLLLAVGVGPRVGGGFRLTPGALFDDGLLDSCLVNPVGRPTMLYMLLRVMRGTHVTSRHVTMRRNHTIHLEAEQALPVHVDGEIFATIDDDVRRLSIVTLPEKLAVAV